MPELTPAGRRLAGLLAVLVLGVPLAGSARAATIAEEMAIARDFFLIADYPSALDKVTWVLRTGAPDPAERLEALALEARCHVALGSRTKAVDSFCSALRSSPAWRPNLAAFTEAERDAFSKAFELCGPLDVPFPRPDDVAATDPRIVSPVDQEPPPPGTLAASRAARPWYRNPWVIGGVGGVIAGVAFLTFGEEEPAPPGPLPDFPAPPE